ncbi:MAG: hypothetical protein ACLQGP_41615, partial [Isosphaeraceae bacterium]
KNRFQTTYFRFQMHIKLSMSRAYDFWNLESGICNPIVSQALSEHDRDWPAAGALGGQPASQGLIEGSGHDSR